MDILSALKAPAAKVAAKLAPIGMKVVQRKPEIFLAAGIAAIVGGAVYVGKATLRSRDILDAEPDMKKAVPKVALEYAPAAALVGGGIALVVASHGEMRGRLAGLSAAYMALDKAYSGYRERVIGELGEEADKKYRLGVESKVVKVTAKDDEGKEHKLHMPANFIHNDGAPYSPYSRFFDEFNTAECRIYDPQYNYMFLTGQQAIANDILQTRGYLFLNEVYRMLGMSETPEGQLVGWMLHNGGDDFVDFGLLEVYNDPARDYVNGSDSIFVLDFNVDGPIWDLL